MAPGARSIILCILFISGDEGVADPGGSCL